MRTLTFQPKFSTTIENIWEMFRSVEDYPKYIQYCHKAVLEGEFKSGSVWWDWSTVMWVPLKVVHQIETVLTREKIVFRIDLPGGKIQQTFQLKESGLQTEVLVRVDIDFKNNLLDFLVGGIVESRNKKMIDATIKNIQRKLQK